MKNRLNLNFVLETAEERVNFVDRYLAEFPYEPTEEELETIANYILYGKASSDAYFNLLDRKGKDGQRSVVNAGYVQINSRYGTAQPEESLDALYEVEGGSPDTQFNFKANLSGRASAPKSAYKKIKQPVFDRDEARAQLRERGLLDLLLIHEDLWKEIDEVEYAVALYEIKTGYRRVSLEVRPELSARMTSAQKEAAEELVSHLNIYRASKLKHHLVELRRQQYVYRDVYRPTILNHFYSRHATEPETSIFSRVLPLGGPSSNSLAALLFSPEVTPAHFSPLFQDYIRRLLLTNEALSPRERSLSFDFTNPNHVALLIYNYNNLFDDSEGADFSEDQEHLNQFIGALNFYIAQANLKPFQHDLLKLKIAGVRNEDISQYIFDHYQKRYRTNYISTIFREKCCREITKAAERHLASAHAILGGPSNFKRCSECGKFLLKSTDYFIRRKSAHDGLSGFCKECGKKKRTKVTKK